MDVARYYSNPIVLHEISGFCKRRWVAIHCETKTKDDRPILLRYTGNKPITISNPEDVRILLKRFSALRPRTFYASASIYRKLTVKSDALDYENNVIRRTPTWDIDSKWEQWKVTIKAAQMIVDALEKEGVTESVYLVWSGNGIHVRIHENAISDDLYSRIGPLNVGYAIVEYIIQKVSKGILRLNSTNGIISPIKVENLMDPQRVFTAPLSLHRHLNFSCIALKPENLEEFDISWVDPKNFKHNPNWRKYIEGEADELAEKAYHKVGNYVMKSVKREEKKNAIDEKTAVKIIKDAILFEIDINNLRFNPSPPPVSGGRKFSKSAREAFYKIEDILSHFALGNISLDHAIRALNYAKNAIIPQQNYPEDVIKKLIEAYNEAISVLNKLRTPEKVKEWLLSHGPPRRAGVSLDSFFGRFGRK